jgi:hypothetical protein
MLLRPVIWKQLSAQAEAIPMFQLLLHASQAALPFKRIKISPFLSGPPIYLPKLCTLVLTIMSSHYISPFCVHVRAVSVGEIS